MGSWTLKAIYSGLHHWHLRIDQEIQQGIDPISLVVSDSSYKEEVSNSILSADDNDDRLPIACFPMAH